MSEKLNDAPPPYNYPPQPGYPPQGSAFHPPQGAAYPPQVQPYPPAPYAPMPPVAGVQPYPQQNPKGPPPCQDQSTVIVTQPPQQIVVVGVGECPRCRQGIISDNFTCCGILLGICFFPLGLVCCFLMRERRCANCGASF